MTQGNESQGEDLWFKQDWKVYQAVLQGNHLEHQCLYNSALKLLAQKRQAMGPLKLVDLGCGDAEYICRMLSQLSEQQEAAPQHEPLLQSYTGVDLSRPALALAQKHLDASLHVSTSTQLDLEDMLSWLQKQGAQAQAHVVFISFALHHLELSKKLQALELARQLLANSNGMLVLIDVFRQPDEDLGNYRSRFVADLDATWDMLDAPGKAIVKSHVCSFDIPESVATYADLSTQAGFTTMEVVAEGTKGFSKLLVFS